MDKGLVLKCDATEIIIGYRSAPERKIGDGRAINARVKASPDCGLSADSKMLRFKLARSPNYLEHQLQSYIQNRSDCNLASCIRESTAEFRLASKAFIYNLNLINYYSILRNSCTKRNLIPLVEKIIIVLFLVTLSASRGVSYANDRKFVPGTNKYFYDNCSDMAPITTYDAALSCFANYVRYNRNYVNKYNSKDETFVEKIIDRYCCKLSQIQKFFLGKDILWSGYFIYVDMDGKERSFEFIFRSDGSVYQIHQETLN